MSRATNSRLVRRTALVAPALLALGGCGGGGSLGASSSFLTKTAGGLSYAQETTVQDQRVCTTTTIRAALPNGQPGVDTSHSCGPASIGHPLLIQAQSSSESLLVDTPSACGAVRAGPTHAALRTLATKCSTGKPLTRATILPSAKRLVIVGVTKVPVINFPRHACRIICVTALA